MFAPADWFVARVGSNTGNSACDCERHAGLGHAFAADGSLTLPMISAEFEANDIDLGALDRLNTMHQ